ncbi:MAG: hypothetical protein L6R28_20725, partial [Planctomycetes bacterium]|nr:hypothetical protein [Planctomycetota bacterium]
SGDAPARNGRDGSCDLLLPRNFRSQGRGVRDGVSGFLFSSLRLRLAPVPRSFPARLLLPQPFLSTRIPKSAIKYRYIFLWPPFQAGPNFFVASHIYKRIGFLKIRGPCAQVLLGQGKENFIFAFDKPHEGAREMLLVFYVSIG